MLRCNVHARSNQAVLKDQFTPAALVEGDGERGGGEFCLDVLHGLGRLGFSTPPGSLSVGWMVDSKAVVVLGNSQ